MAKVRVYYEVGGKVHIVRPIEKSRRPNETEAQWLKRVYEKTEVHKRGLLFDDIDTVNLPAYNTRAKWRGSKGQGVKVDDTIVTIPEKIKALEDEMDTELAKTNPNMPKVMRAQRKLDKKEYD